MSNGDVLIFEELNVGGISEVLLDSITTILNLYKKSSI